MTATTIANAATATAATVVSKADKARKVFNEAYADPTKVPARKDIIAKMVTEAGLTPKGAATYLQNFKSKAGLVVKKAAAPAVATA